MYEPAVTLTDYGLTIECVILSLLLVRKSASSKVRSSAILFFLSVGVASLIGGTVHGFFPDSKWLWQLTLIAIGMTSVTLWRIAAQRLSQRQLREIITVGADVFFIAYVVLIVFVTQHFAIAILAYLPPALFLLGIFVLSLRRGPSHAARYGITGIILTLVASGLQQFKLGVHPVYLDHNAVYHILQAISLWRLYLCFSRLIHRQD